MRHNFPLGLTRVVIENFDCTGRVVQKTASESLIQRCFGPGLMRYISVVTVNLSRSLELCFDRYLQKCGQLEQLEYTHKKFRQSSLLALLERVINRRTCVVHAAWNLPHLKGRTTKT